MIPDDLFDKVVALNVRRQKVSELCHFHLEALSIFTPEGELQDIAKKQIHISGFAQLRPNKREKQDLKKSRNRLSITSTMTCLRSLFMCPDFRPERNADYSDLLKRLGRRWKTRKLDTSELKHGNPYTVGLLLPVLKHIPTVLPSSAIVKGCVGFAKTAIAAGGARIDDFDPSGYMTYWLLRGLEAQGENISAVGSAALNWANIEFNRQLALFEAGEGDRQDAYQLGYNFLIQHRYARDNMPLSVRRRGLDILFKAQLPRGVWEKQFPLFVYGRAGDAYPFSFELLTELLSEFQGCADELFIYEENLERAFQWAIRNQEHCDGIPLWCSRHRAIDKRPESWTTAEVYLFLQLYRTILSEWTQGFVLTHFRSPVKVKANISALSELYSPIVTLTAEKNRKIALNKLLEERMIAGLKVSIHGRETYSLAAHPDRKSRTRSGILFGPPGTGKTSYVKALASRLGWPLVILNPSDFSRNGFQKLHETTKHIFDLLFELEDTVIFFDEMEELLRVRSGDNAGTFEQRFLTTSLLPMLQNLYNGANSIFIVATNHFESIDMAAKRDGRFDFYISILPLPFNSKVKMLRDEWDSPAVPAELVAEVRKHADKFAWATWVEMMRVIASLRREPARARDITDDFLPSLYADREKHTEELRWNKFPESA